MDYGRRNRFAPRGSSLFEMQSAGRLATRAMRRRWNFWSQRRCQMGWSFAGGEEGRLLQAERSWLGRRLLRVGDFGSSALLLRGTIKAFQMALRRSDEWARRRRHSADWRALCGSSTKLKQGRWEICHRNRNRDGFDITNPLYYHIRIELPFRPKIKRRNVTWPWLAVVSAPAISYWTHMHGSGFM